MVSLFLRQFKLLLIYLQKRLDSYNIFNARISDWYTDSFNDVLSWDCIADQYLYLDAREASETTSAMIKIISELGFNFKIKRKFGNSILNPGKLSTAENETTLTLKNTSFSREFLLQIYDCFLKNKELDAEQDKLFVYSRIKNKIIRKRYENLGGLGESLIVQSMRSNTFWNLMQDKYDENCADWFIKKLCFIENWKEFKEQDFYEIDAKKLEEVAKEYFNTLSKVNDVKAYVAKSWLTRINAKKILI